MRILHISDTLHAGGSTILTVGNFDGVHRGHAALIRETVRRAAGKSMKSAVVTFDPPTGLVLGREKGFRLLTTFEEKAKLIAALGVDYLIRVPFDDAVRRMEPETFVFEFLVRKLRMTEWVLGPGHGVGRNRSGDEKFLHAIESKYHFTTFLTGLMTIGETVVSSTRIREHITHGSIAEAVRWLGHPYLVSVERTAGKKRGIRFGYPTLNFRSPPSWKVIPVPGVYAAELEYGGRCEEGALYFGECPTLHEPREIHFEFYSFNRGKEEIGAAGGADLWLYSFIRPDNVFAGTGDLVEQMGRDVEMIRTFFVKEKVQWR